ncbi:hypothetical protein AAFF_G00387400 [Aldrovandia affinis]|uniref:Uncharacterized protein n=1 Tax=Aldrovandia affinis TaxID=143900 RepID=A0AAD7WLH5_9TELE|nr:hypothetical protein AAFF_G00387400 [Aldrovandia affinis]
MLCCCCRGEQERLCLSSKQVKSARKRHHDDWRKCGYRQLQTAANAPHRRTHGHHSGRAASLWDGGVGAASDQSICISVTWPR